MTDQTSRKVRASRRLPRIVEREIAKLLGTLRFDAYGAALWDLAHASPSVEEAAAPAQPISPVIASQIADQGRHDPAVLAAGRQTIPFLKQRVRSLQNQHGVDAGTLFDGVSQRVDAVLVVSRADATGGLDALLEGIGAQAPLVVVTDENGAADGSSTATADGSRPRMIFWRDHVVAYNAANARLFALFLHALGPAIVLVHDSRLGLDMLARYGRALMRFHRLFWWLGGPADPGATPPAFSRYLRSASAHAAIIAPSEKAASAVVRYGLDPDGPGVHVLEASPRAQHDEYLARAANVFGRIFADGRSPASARALGALLAGATGITGDGTVAPQPKPRGEEDIDITVTIVFHRERQLAIPALASLRAMVATARDEGIVVEARALLDRSDAITRELVTRHGDDFVDIEEVDFGDLGLTRNAGTARARGAYAAFLDGDDLWGARWLANAYRAATAPGVRPDAIWHPAVVYLFYERDFDVHTPDVSPHPDAASVHYLHRTSCAPDFDLRDALLENPWSANAFAATSVFRRFPYRANDWAWQSGIEDWRWNIETLGSGLAHMVAPETVHVIRVKDTGSLSVESDARGLLPILT